MRLVVFAGAGFSAGYGYPTMDSFLGHADASRRLSADDKALLNTLVLEARRANSFLESSPTNLEDILSFSEMGDRLMLSDPSEKRGERLRQLVRSVFTEAVAGDAFWTRYEKVRTLVGRKQYETEPELAFITTNYDLNIECACLRAGWGANPGFELKRFEDSGVHTTGLLYHKEGLPVFKLHGSVNWHVGADSSDLLIVEDRVVRMTGGAELPLVSAQNYAAPGAPLIVPPSFLKPELSGPLKGAWSGAAKALAAATVVVFVGYSFPPSDTEMMYFLARALTENAGLRRVWIIDPNADSIVRRLREPQSRMGSHFRNLIRAVPAKWQDLNVSIPELQSVAP